MLNHRHGTHVARAKWHQSKSFFFTINSIINALRQNHISLSLPLPHMHDVSTHLASSYSWGAQKDCNLCEDAACSCGQGDQTMDHLLFHCTRTRTQRELLKHQICKQTNWPASKQDLISKHRKLFGAFIESIDFELLQQNDQ